MKAGLQAIKKSIDRIVPRLARHFSVRYLILFGSAGSAKQGPMSDIDFAVSFGENVTNEELLVKALDLASELEQALGGKEIDLVTIEDAPPALKFKIFATGHVLFEATTGVVEDAYVRVLAEHYDNQIFLDSQFAAVEEYLQRGTE